MDVIHINGRQPIAVDVLSLHAQIKALRNTAIYLSTRPITKNNRMMPYNEILNAANLLDAILHEFEHEPSEEY